MSSAPPCQNRMRVKRNSPWAVDQRYRGFYLRSGGLRFAQLLVGQLEA
jgi:hypothetical protein